MTATMVRGFVTTSSAGVSRKKFLRPLYMVRNIDLPEALVFYGRKIMFQDDSCSVPRDGLLSLLEECRQVETATILINDDDSSKSLDLPLDMKDVIVFDPSSSSLESKPPNPRFLWEAIHSLEIQPRGFGGSSGFGRKQADQFKRNPLPQHVVVFCQTEENGLASLDVSQAARMAGMRVVSFDMNDDLADAVVDQEDGFYGMYLDDISTPGSYWLNPPIPRDADGNRVDPVEIMEWYESNKSKKNKKSSRRKDKKSKGDEEPQQPPLSDDEFHNILADLDPL